MVTKHILQELDCESILDYFAYILTSYEVGQMRQVEKLIDKMNQSQKLVFISYLAAHATPEQNTYCTNYLIGK